MPLSYSSSIPGIGGTLKQSLDDFVVEEILSDGRVAVRDSPFISEGSTGKFTHFILQKRDWSTEGALARLSRALRTSPTHFNYAGTKDKVALTTQRVSCFGKTPAQFASLAPLKDISVLGAWQASDKVRLGDLLGNKFTIRVNGCMEHPAFRIETIYSALNGSVPNYFGEQRFGSTRRNTHIVGKLILQNSLEAAADEFLCSSEGEGNLAAKEARTELKDTHDYAKAFNAFPPHLRIERQCIAHLAKNPNDYANAFRKIPRSILLMFIHAFQSHLFNEQLSGRITKKDFVPRIGEYCCGMGSFGFPDLENHHDEGILVGKLIGHQSTLSDEEVELLDSHGLTQDSFKLRFMPEIGTKGTHRACFVPLKDFAFKDGIFSFSLPSGSYATVALREFLDTKT